MSQLTLIATMVAKPGREEELGAALQGLVAPSRAEAGCINYDLHRSRKDPGVWVMYENWTSPEALEEHMATPHLQAFAARVDDLTAGGIELHELTMISRPAGR